VHPVDFHCTDVVSNFTCCFKHNYLVWYTPWRWSYRDRNI